MPTHAMIDLETLDTTPKGVILTIGGVKFNPLDIDSNAHSDFYMRLEINNQEERGRLMHQSTLDWWGRQEESIINEAFGDVDRHSVEDMLVALKKWFVGCDKVWAQGICFDISMLEDVCRQYGYPIPWAFYQVEDARTLINRMPRDPRKEIKFAAHNALEDCRAQAKALQMTFKHFGFEK
jgi:hypothetical protein